MVFCYHTTAASHCRRRSNRFLVCLTNTTATTTSCSFILTTLLLLQLASTSTVAADAGSAREGTITYNGYTYGVINSELIIPCGVLQLVNRSDSSESVAWFKGGRPLENTEYVSAVGDDLVIPKFSHDLGDDYQCTKTYDFGTVAGDVFKLRAPETFPIIFDDESVVLAAGDTLRLVCPIHSWAPALSVLWFKDSQALALDTNRVEMLPGSVLLITNLTETDAGDYSCSSRAVDGQFMASVNTVSLSINDSAQADSYRMLSIPTDVEALLDEELVLECVLLAANGERTQWQQKVEREGIQWVEVSESSLITIEPIKYIRWSKVNAAVGGEYRCNVLSSTNHLLHSFPTTVTIAYAPTLTESLFREITVDLSSFGKLTCDAIGSPEPTIIWFKDGLPLDICHDTHVSEGTLTIERVSMEDSGLYQCMATNQHGTESLFYQLTVPLKSVAGIPSVPVITEATFINPMYVEIDWQMDDTVIYCTMIYARETCLPGIRSDSKVINIDGENICRQCEGSVLICCSYRLEVHTNNENYMLHITAFNKFGSQKSLPFIATALDNVSTTPAIYRPLDLNATDFGSVILVQWKSVQDAAGYRLNKVERFHHTNSYIHSELRERSNEQSYSVIEASKENSTLSVEVVAVHDPVIYREDIVLNITRPIFTGLPAAPVLTIMNRDYDSSRGIMVLWTKYPGVSYYYVWYKCDSREVLKQLEANAQMIMVEVVERRCTIVIAPVVGDEARPAGVGHYERWCQSIVTPTNLTVTPYHSEENGDYPMMIEWKADNGNTSCEVNYQVRWKRAVSDFFKEGDSLIVRNDYTTVVQGLVADFTYEFQVMAFTNISDVTRLSATVSYTVGPPLNAKNVAVDTRAFPAGPAVLTWSSGQSGHEINLYIVMLYEWTDDKWNLCNVTTVNVQSGDALRVEYSNLTVETHYTVNISSVNSQGKGGVTSHRFTTPIVTPSTAKPTKPAQPPSGTSPATNIPTPIEIGVIIGFALSFLVILLSVLVCVLVKRRYKSDERRRQQCRNRSARFETSGSSYSCQQPLTIDTSHYEMSTCLGDKIVERVPNGDVEHSLPLTSLGSPQQPSNQATSGQDSGIDGTADDHRSSQDLEEYDEGEELINSSLSLSSSSSSSQPVLSKRWSGEHSYNIDSARMRTESECDSLLTDSRKTDQTLHNKLLNRSTDIGLPAATQISGYQSLDNEMSGDVPALTNSMGG